MERIREYLALCALALLIGELGAVVTLLAIGMALI